MSQLIPTDRPVLPRGNAKNDMSLWGGVVVGTSDFAPAPSAKPDRSNVWKWAAGGLALVVAGIAAFFIVSGGGGKPASPTAKSVAPVTPEAKDVKDAAVAVTTPDAAVVVAVVDAAVAPAPTVAAVAVEVDAISGAAELIKPVKKKKLVRKTPAKKKAAPKKATPKRK